MQTDQVTSRGLKPWGNPYEMHRGPGYQIDWERTSDYFAGGKFTVKLAAAAAIGADALTVDALTRPVKAGEKIQFPDVKTVTVTLTGNEAIGQTDLAVAALSGPIPAGTVLDFGTGEERVKTTADAAAGATSLLVEALTIALETGDAATYQGGEHNVEVLEDAATGATSLAVGNLQFAIADDTEGIVQRSGYSAADKFIPEGTVMALDATSKKMFPRHDADTEEAFALITSDASNSRQHASDSKSGYGTVIGGTFLYENLLPDADTDGNIPSAYKTELAANSLGFTYRDYTDTRV